MQTISAVINNVLGRKDAFVAAEFVGGAGVCVVVPAADGLVVVAVVVVSVGDIEGDSVVKGYTQVSSSRSTRLAAVNSDPSGKRSSMVSSSARNMAVKTVSYKPAAGKRYVNGFSKATPNFKRFIVELKVTLSLHCIAKSIL